MNAAKAVIIVNFVWLHMYIDVDLNLFIDSQGHNMNKLQYISLGVVKILSFQP